MITFANLIPCDYTYLFHIITENRVKGIPLNPIEKLFQPMWEMLNTRLSSLSLVPSFMKGLGDELGEKDITDHDIKFLVGKAFGTYYVYMGNSELLDRYTRKLCGEGYAITDLIRSCYQMFSRDQIPMVHLFIDHCKEGVEEYFLKYKGLDLSHTKSLLNWDKVKEEEKKLMKAKRKR